MGPFWMVGTLLDEVSQCHDRRNDGSWRPGVFMEEFIYIGCAREKHGFQEHIPFSDIMIASSYSHESVFVFTGFVDLVSNEVVQ